MRAAHYALAIVRGEPDWPLPRQSAFRQIVEIWGRSALVLADCPNGGRSKD